MFITLGLVWKLTTDQPKPSKPVEGQQVMKSDVQVETPRDASTMGNLAFFFVAFPNWLFLLNVNVNIVVVEQLEHLKKTNAALHDEVVHLKRQIFNKTSQIQVFFL